MRSFDDDIRTRASAKATLIPLEAAALELQDFISGFDDDYVFIVPDSTSATTDRFPSTHHRDMTGTIVAHLCNKPTPRRQFWETWILHESCRRTWLAVMMFLALNRVVQGNVSTTTGCGSTSGNMPVARHAVTLSAHLWGADDAVIDVCEGVGGPEAFRVQWSG